MFSPVTVVNGPPAEVAAGGIPLVAVVTPVARRSVSSLALDLIVVPVGGTTAEKPASAVVTGGLSKPPVAVVTPAGRRSAVVPAGETTAEEPAVVADGLSRPPVTVVTAPARLSAPFLELAFMVSPAESTSEEEPAIELVTGGIPAPSDDKLDRDASTPWVVSGCTCVSVCCPVLGGTCEPEVFGPCVPALEIEVSDAMLAELARTMSKASCRFSCEFSKAALEEDALISGCAVEPS